MPNISGKIYAKNLQKGYSTELRRLPALEMTVAITEAYPSAQPPEIHISSDFYLKYEQ